ncbi:PadR family transcriptional regulator [Microbacterium sp. SORGH_AS_0888]|uniref:PadR family transcriptional regulator n=1 Tax=Microbacterium sp. SORGH_AS_0888 TaxID=3041791 RepID=UPI00278A6A1E|nr:PadR family transcriptional regulator [Microbacterium sp. SORGH_AS_0888]MDQ1130818.1 DNA-binding PadR family transcriptional regulator [Microbacterium sp. SORGH_AS_0888]
MSGTFGGGFGGGSRGFGGFADGLGGIPGADGLREAFDQLRTAFDKRVGPRMGRGDVRAAVLALLLEQPMHGYQIIREIEDRSGGVWKPSAGSVYPTLQLLSDEGMIEASESNGRKTYSLTEVGRAEAEAAADKQAPWESSGLRDSGRVTALPKAGMELAQVAAQVARTGSSEQVVKAVDVLDEARRKLYGILAQD